MKNVNKIAVITGASSGIGSATARLLAERGCRVYDLSRRDNDNPNVIHIKTDITDDYAVCEAVEEIISREGRIDILINNAGMGISGSVEFTDTDDAKRLFDVNFFGTVRVTSKVLGYMRKAKSGRIVNISSVAAVVPIPFQTFYSASKAAINSYTMALACEVKPFGISVVSIMPGDISSGFTAAREKSTLGDDIYGGRIERSVKTMEKDEQNGMKPDFAAKAIVKTALSKNKKPCRAIGISYKVIAVLAKLLPCRLLNKIVGILYAK